MDQDASDAPDPNHADKNENDGAPGEKDAELPNPNDARDHAADAKQNVCAKATASALAAVSLSLTLPTAASSLSTHVPLEEAHLRCVFDAFVLPPPERATEHVPVMDAGSMAAALEALHIAVPKDLETLADKTLNNTGGIGGNGGNGGGGGVLSFSPVVAHAKTGAMATVHYTYSDFLALAGVVQGFHLDRINDVVSITQPQSRPIDAEASVVTGGTPPPPSPSGSAYSGDAHRSTPRSKTQHHHADRDPAFACEDASVHVFLKALEYVIRATDARAMCSTEYIHRRSRGLHLCFLCARLGNTGSGASGTPGIKKRAPRRSDTTIYD